MPIEFLAIQDFDHRFGFEQMGTSMRNAVFPEGVVNGLKRWRKRARKNLAIKNKYWRASPSLDASVEDNSPSFSVLDPSLSVELGYTNTSTMDDWNTSAEEITSDEDSDNGKQVVVQPEKIGLGSFKGFNMDKMQ